jgi:hypothetical protein
MQLKDSRNTEELQVYQRFSSSRNICKCFHLNRKYKFTARIQNFLIWSTTTFYVLVLNVCKNACMYLYAQVGQVGKFAQV